MALWAEWFHVGGLEVIHDSEVLVCSAEDFLSNIWPHFLVGALCLRYGAAFHKYLIDSRPPLAKWPNDLRVPCVEYADIVASMPVEARTCIGMAALDRLKSGWYAQMLLPRASILKLETELRAGRSILVATGSG